MLLRSSCCCCSLVHALLGLMSASAVCTRIMVFCPLLRLILLVDICVCDSVLCTVQRAPVCVVLLHMLTTDGAELVDRVLEYVPIRVNSGSTGNVFDELPR